MEIIKLTVKPQTLEALKAGVLKEYAREIRPNTQAKYCEIDEEGYVKYIDGVLQLRRYDAVRFSCSHESCAFRIDAAQIELFEDDNGELVTYTEGGEEYIAAQIVCFLGDSIRL